MSLLRRSPALAAAALLRLYRLTVSPLYGDRCKYHPTCSQYALDAVREVGLVRGSVLAGWRLLRCNPWSHGGVDRVADRTLFRAHGGHAGHPRSEGHA
jgi:putative membrane protein insertion efficiency factor